VSALFLTGAFLHIFLDAFMHAGAWTPLAPLPFTITSSFNYWTSWVFVAAYWVVLLMLLFAAWKTRK
jgi:membrane-bound metal-dependent hydrolase YbcI (DUF457 family)